MAGNANSGRRRPLPLYDPTLTPLKLLKQIVKNQNAPPRERTTAALGLLTHERTKKRAKQLTKAEREWQECREAGWWCRGWHIGFEDDSVSPDDPNYGRNLLNDDIGDRTQGHRRRPTHHRGYRDHASA